MWPPSTQQVERQIPFGTRLGITIPGATDQIFRKKSGLLDMTRAYYGCFKAQNLQKKSHYFNPPNSMEKLEKSMFHQSQKKWSNLQLDPKSGLVPCHGTGSWREIQLGHEFGHLTVDRHPFSPSTGERFSLCDVFALHDQLIDLLWVLETWHSFNSFVFFSFLLHLLFFSCVGFLVICCLSTDLCLWILDGNVDPSGAEAPNPPWW